MDNNQLNDKQLLKLLNRNPERGFRALLDLYGGTVKAVCRNMLSGFTDEDIEEAVADCFIAFWKSRSKLVKSNSLKSYLIGISKHCALDKMRKILKNAQTLPIDDTDFSINIEMSSEAEQQINCEIVRGVIASMPAFEREIFIRRYYLCEKVKSIAENMQCSPKKVENILCRYKKRLKDELIKGGINI